MFETHYRAREASAAPVRKSSILVVDDSRSVRELVRLHLGNAGYDVVVAEDAVEAGKFILHRAPDLMIVDIVMPYMSGVELVEALKADRAVPRFPVVLLSSKDDVDEHARRLGAVAYLSKPVSADRLIQIVQLYAAAA